jgi:hypothetical protein
MDSVHSDGVRTARACERWAADGECGGDTPVVDRSAGDIPRANPPFGYVVSIIRLHECGFTMPVSRFMRGLCYHYGVELHNFAPNAISEAATFVGIYEGFLGIPVNWDLWIHLFCAELHTVATNETRVRWAVGASGLTFVVRDSRRSCIPRAR